MAAEHDGSAPVWLDDFHLDPEWAKSVLPVDSLYRKAFPAASNGRNTSNDDDDVVTLRCTDVSNASRRGSDGSPRFGATVRVEVVVREGKKGNGEEEEQVLGTYVLKQAVSDAGLEQSRRLGLAREALFYGMLLAPGNDDGDGRRKTSAAVGTPQLQKLLPKVYFASGDMDSGIKYVLMEDFNGSYVDSGILFGRGNPNNWDRDLPNLIASAYPTSSQTVPPVPPTPPTPAQVAGETFRSIARFHARFWRLSDPLLSSSKEHGWLRGFGWIQGEEKESWMASQRFVQQLWKKYSSSTLSGGDRGTMAAGDIEWDPLVKITVNKAVEGISWEKQLERLNKEGEWTLVHGDFWPGNVMWNYRLDRTRRKKTTAARTQDEETDKTELIKLIDWEMVGIGSGPQDLGQYVLSNMDPIDRRSCERNIVEVYWKELLKNGVDRERVTWEYCWNEYRVGGVERFLWFLVYFVGQGQAEWAQFFHDQIASFMHDHSLTPDDITQPRP